MPDPMVWVRRSWNDSRNCALYPLTALEHVRWSIFSGGRKVFAPAPFLSSVVDCTGALEGKVNHFGIHGSRCPHAIKVFVVKKGNNSAVIAALVERAGERPPPWELTLARDALVAIQSAGEDGMTRRELKRMVLKGEWPHDALMAYLRRRGVLIDSKRLRAVI